MHRVKDIECEVSEYDIDLALKKSKNTSPGHDNIYYILIKQLPSAAKQLLAQIYQQCMELAYFPRTWKTAITIMIPKPDKNHQDPNNYRPISLLSNLGKTLERIINNRLTSFIEINNILPGTQSGFRKGRSTQDQLFRLLQDATNQKRRKHSNLSCFFDLHKAYDKLWIEGLIYKLKLIGLTQHTQILLTSFLTNRQVIFRINNTKSSPLNPTASTPQGAILSPLIFNLMVSDIPQPEPPVHLSQFADDIATWSNEKTIKRAKKSLQNYNNKLSSWCNQWKLKLSTEKTQLIAFGKRKGLAFEEITQVINGDVIQAKQNAKFLGIILDDRLTLSLHYKQIKKSLQTRVKIFYKITGSYNYPRCPSDLSLKILKSMIIPVITYAPVATALFTKSMFKNLDSIIRSGAKMALFCKRTTSNDYVYEKANLKDSYGLVLFSQARKYLQHPNRSPEIKSLMTHLIQTRSNRRTRAERTPSLFDKLFPEYEV
jgi:hypothetical protein